MIALKLKGSTFLVLALLVIGSQAARADDVLNMTCNDAGGLKRNLTIYLANKSVAEEDIIPNPGGSPDPVVSTHTIVDPAMKVSDQSVDWTEEQGDNTPRWQYSLNRYTGSLHVTKAPGGIWPNGWNDLFTCERRQKPF